MFRPEGVWLDFGNEERQYLAFERSGSMSRQAQLSFLRADVYDAVRRRIQMDMTIRDCQLSKLYAYNGLMLSSGVRVEGVDYDGDMVKTIADPIINACVRRNYRTSDGQEGQALSNEENLPLLMIPAAEPRIADADDWRARMETVKGTFSSRIGQICNAALDRSVIAYNENSEGEERRRCREETETLAILVGLEIDSAKSGVRPDLDEYLGRRDIQRTPFLRYKDLVERAEERRAWYEPTPRPPSPASAPAAPLFGTCPASRTSTASSTPGDRRTTGTPTSCILCSAFWSRDELKRSAVPSRRSGGT